jgi:hypothetical protein
MLLSRRWSLWGTLRIHRTQSDRRPRYAQIAHAHYPGNHSACALNLSPILPRFRPGGLGQDTVLAVFTGMR